MMPYTAEDKERFDVYSQVHLRSNNDLPDTEKIPVLEKKLRSKNIHLIINMAIIVIFIFLYMAGFTTFADWFYFVLFGVFLLNVFLIHLQKKQINSLIEYLNTKIERGI